MRQAHDSLHQRLHAGVPIDVQHETLVDFQVVDRQTLQITERRITRPEIVDGDAHAQAPQFGDLPCGVLRVPHQHSLGEFQLQIARFHFVHR